MDLGLSGKSALVLASSRGLGLGVATALVQEGARVLITGRGEERLKLACTELNAKGPGTADYLIADFSAPGVVDTLVRGAKEKLGAVDILVNNTGGPPPGKVTDVVPEIWDTQFAAMVRNVFVLTAALVPDMRERGWGRILTLASSGVVQPIPNLGISNALRSALVGWSKTLSAEIAADGVTANILAPGRIHTERVDELDAAAAKRTGKPVEEVSAASRASIPARRYGRVEEFAAVAAFLVSEPASYVTGTVMRCDGGSIQSV
ncbi:3-oxoacyl-[acyl-carrier protein] reductase [Faunimonas pinastri]|uniref:3-oxoacyl-[acyl-carrier protein] reductase n=1 Tax=Faunimonas pinastri TaxID=1855383 RepID=A0A1H9E7A2_9HYPH|nr:SDR family oxidoreductase [Faunimonas pinastri]SEQ21634.1 3-oxoacyl-[acyl-carrier protein] reductase [Faunimonas pinastri]